MHVYVVKGKAFIVGNKTENYFDYESQILL